MGRQRTAALVALSLVTISTPLFNSSAAWASAGSTRPAANTAKLKAVQDRADLAIGARLAALSRWTGIVAGAKHLSVDDRAALTAEIGADTGGLTNLKATIDADTDLPSAVTQYRSIFTGYRVFALVDRQVAYVRAADAEASIAVKLTTASTKVQAALGTRPDGGTSAQHAAANDLSAQITALVTDETGVVAAVLSVTPDQVVDPTAPPAALVQARQSLLAGQAAAKAAVADLTTLRNSALLG